MVDVPVDVKKAFKKGRSKKQYRIEVYTINDDNTLTYEFTIGNDNLVKESVKIDERMCSDRYLKFGLCEGSSMEFQYFGMESVTGKELKVYLDVWYDDGEGGAWYPIMMGYYTVDTSSTQFSTGIRKVTAYNKLQAKYLDEKANSLILEEFGFEDEAYAGDVVDTLLDGYSIEKNYQKVEPYYQSYNYAYSGYTAAYKYSSLYGDQGPFGPELLSIMLHDPDWTINENCYMNVYAGMVYYQNTKNPVTNEYYPIKIKAPDYFDEIDNNIATFIKGHLNEINSSTSGATLWSRLQNLKGDQSVVPLKYLKNYFFNITVEYSNGELQPYTYEYYGNNVLNSSGTFEELSKKTLLNVVSVTVLVPTAVDFGRKDAGAMYWEDISTSIMCYGPDRRYLYETSNGDLFAKAYTTPKMPDGTDIPRSYDTVKEVIVSKIIGGDSEADYIKVDPKTLPEVTLRELQSAIYEMNCQYGQINRETDLFSGVELGGIGLYPSETLYPADNLYPNGNTGGKAIHPYPAEYQKLWTDTVGVQSFRYLRITYKAIEDGNEVEKVLQRTVHEHGTQNYNMSDNWLFLNLVWTAEQVGAYADAMVEKMRDITWFPFEMWSVGLPYVETGDAIEIADKEGNTYTSYILQRQLRGIQNLQDSFINGELDVF